jgi:hypothetical protein
MTRVAVLTSVWLVTLIVVSAHTTPVRYVLALLICPTPTSHSAAHVPWRGMIEIMLSMKSCCLTVGSGSCTTGHTTSFSPHAFFALYDYCSRAYLAAHSCGLSTCGCKPCTAHTHALRAVRLHAHTATRRRVGE